MNILKLLFQNEAFIKLVNIKQTHSSLNKSKGFLTIHEI